VRGLAKDVFKGLRYSLTWSNEYCAGRDKRGALVEKDRGPWQKNCCCNKFLMIFFEGKRR
jgi:hypothetical protein